ncbi:MAG TPA: DinB family protein [Steroidobacteraceae bacterium]|nr:DinB family protein [Steroidobacteraceae bacterium]
MNPDPQASAVGAATLATLRAFPDLLEAHFALFPQSHRHWAPASWDGVPSEALTAIEQLCHVRDIEIEGYQRRIERTLAERNPFLPSMDTDALARDRRYAIADPGEVLTSFREARRRTVAIVERLTPGQLERPADFEGYGPVTLRALIHYLCSHDQQHLAGLQWLLGKVWSGQK